MKKFRTKYFKFMRYLTLKRIDAKRIDRHFEQANFKTKLNYIWNFFICFTSTENTFPFLFYSENSSESSEIMKREKSNVSREIIAITNRYVYTSFF